MSAASRPPFADSRLQQVHVAFARQEKVLEQHIAALRIELEAAQSRVHALEAEQEQTRARADGLQLELDDAVRQVNADLQASHSHNQQLQHDLQSLQGECLQVRQQAELTVKTLEIRRLELQSERDGQALHAQVLSARANEAERVSRESSSRQGELSAQLSLTLAAHKEAWEQVRLARDAERSALAQQLDQSHAAHALELNRLDALCKELQSQLREERRSGAASQATLQARDTELSTLRGLHLQALQRAQDQAASERLQAQAERESLTRAHGLELGRAAETARVGLELSAAELHGSRQLAEVLRADIEQLRAAQEFQRRDAELAARGWSAELKATETIAKAARAGLESQMTKAAALDSQVKRLAALRLLAIRRGLVRRASLRQERQNFRMLQIQLQARAGHALGLAEELTVSRDLRRQVDQFRALSVLLEAERSQWATRVGQADDLLLSLDRRRVGLKRGQHRQAIDNYFASLRLRIEFPRPLSWAQLAEEIAVNAKQELPVRATAPAHVDALLALPGIEFVDATYQTILGRGADPEGRAFFCNRLLEGVGKLQILREFAESPEARARGLTLPGLAAALARMDARKGGWRRRVLSWLGATAHQEGLELHLNRLQAGMEMNHCALQGQMAELGRRMQAVEQRQDDVETSLAAANGDEGLAAQLERHQIAIESLRLRTAQQRFGNPSPHLGRTPLATLSSDERAGVRA